MAAKGVGVDGAGWYMGLGHYGIPLAVKLAQVQSIGSHALMTKIL